MIDLDCSARIMTPTGWIELADRAGGYELGPDAFTQAAVSHRKSEISSEWLEGTFVTRSVRENVTETVSVYVYGDSPYELATRLDALTDGFDQLQYSMVVRFGDAQHEWDCWVADYTIATRQEMRFATMALVSAQVPRLPAAARTQVWL